MPRTKSTIRSTRQTRARQPTPTPPPATPPPPTPPSAIPAVPTEPTPPPPSPPQLPTPLSHSIEAEHVDIITLTTTSPLLGVLYRQTTDDMNAYTYDRDYCRHVLQTESVLPEESRTLRLRILDAEHNIRRCKQKLELVAFEAKTGVSPSLILGDRGTIRAFIPTTSQVAVPLNGPFPPEETSETPEPAAKRQRRVEDLLEGTPEENQDVVTRLGYWKCRLCTSAKYLGAGPGRQPIAPCKWPLKDVAKMIAHFTEMHHEHTTEERCEELGLALQKNRGPFEYWLTKTHGITERAQETMEEAIMTLREGRLPGILRQLSRAAAGFPES